LNLAEGDEEQLSITTFGSEAVHHVTARTTRLCLHLRDSQSLTITATIVPTITGHMTRTAIPTSVCTQWQHLWAGLHLADSFPAAPTQAPIDILLGSDFYNDVMLPDRREIVPGLYLLQSRLGWVFSGRVRHAQTDVRSSTDDPTLLIINQPSLHSSRSLSFEEDPGPPNVKPNLEAFWQLESIGITDCPSTNDDDTAMQLFESTVTRVNSQPAVLQQYDGVLQQQIKLGIIKPFLFSQPHAQVLLQPLSSTTSHPPQAPHVSAPYLYPNPHMPSGQLPVLSLQLSHDLL